MKQPHSEYQRFASFRPAFFPLAGFIVGIMIWFIDAFIDVYLLDEEQSLIENILTPDESTEFWMRSLVLIVFVLMGIFSRHVLLKQIELDSLLMDYQVHLESMIRERTESLQNKTRELELLASTDSLTGLLNRRKFSETLNLEIKRFIRYKKAFSLINIDIDHFKKVNDTYGHDIGDKVITAFADILKQNIRDSDSAARWGGEEFLILIIETRAEEAIEITEKLLALIRETQIEPVGNTTASIGVTSVRQGDTEESILIRSDQALYKAKDNGRNRIEVL